jgi:hypothetical protein
MYDPEARMLEVEIEPDGDAAFTTQFIGTLDGSVDVGVVLATAHGRRPKYRLTGRELYVRAVITSSRPPPNPSFEGQTAQAWTQPVGWAGRLRR